MSAGETVRAGPGPRFHQGSLWVRAVVYALTVALCVPAKLLEPMAVAGHPLLVPLLTLGMALAWVLGRNGRMPAIGGNLSLLWLSLSVFFGLVLVSSWVSPDRSTSLSLCGAYLARLVLFFVLVQICVDDPGLERNLARLFPIALAVLALLMVSGSLESLGHVTWVGDLTHGFILRASAGIGDPNLTAFAFNIGLALALAWFAGERRAARKVLALLVSLVLVWGIGRTVSIGGLIGLLVVLVLSAWFLFPKAGRRGGTLMALTLGLFSIIVLAAGGVYLERIHTQVIRSEHSIGAVGSERLNLALGGIAMAASHPLWGVGLANINADMPPYLPFPISDPKQGPHDLWLAVPDESGIPSLLALTVAGGIIFWLGWRAHSRLRASPDRESYFRHTGLWVATLASAVQSLALGTQRDRFFWFLLALLVASAWQTLALLRAPVPGN